MLSEKSRPLVVLAFGLLAVSTAAIFIRLAQEENVPSLVIAAGRMLTASVVLTPIVLRRYWAEVRGLQTREIQLGLISGVFLAIHFATWITSLEYTSVTASVVLVTTNPLFVALLSLPMLGEKVSRKILMGIGLAFLGGLLVAFSGDAGDPPTRAEPLLGNGLAVLGSVTVALYFLIGRRLRARLSLVTYIWMVYSTAAIVLCFVVLIQGQRVTGYPAIAYLWIIAMGLLAQVIGHSSFNYALGHLPAAYVSLVVLGEPIGSTILAMIFLNEFPAELAVLGSAIILTGIGLASRPARQPEKEVAEPVI